MTLKYGVCLTLACSALTLLAQTAPPSTAQMIEQLKPPRTRSMVRNLVVEAAPTPAGVSAAQAPAAVSAANAMPGTASGASEQPVQAGAIAARPSLSLLIQFDFNSARIRPESQQVLTSLAQALQSAELQSSRFAVEGHTDAKGGIDYNLRLSRQRAQEVREFLKAKGVVDSRLVALGRGSFEPANRDDPLAAENRRVRIVNLEGFLP